MMEAVWLWCWALGVSSDMPDAQPRAECGPSPWTNYYPGATDIKFVNAMGLTKVSMATPEDRYSKQP